MLAKVIHNKEAWVFSGGGAKGYYSSKLLQLMCHFAENCLVLRKPGILAGSSIGAIQAAVLAELLYQNKSLKEATDKMMEFWEKYPLRISLLNIIRGRSIFSEIHIKNLLSEIIDPDRKIADYKKAGIDLIITTTDLNAGQTMIFAPEYNVIEALSISAALPFAFPSRCVNGNFLTDGGALENVPADNAMKKGASSLRIFYLEDKKNFNLAPEKEEPIYPNKDSAQNKKKQQKTYKSAFKVFFKLFDILMTKVTFHEVEEVRKINRILCQAEYIQNPIKKAEYLKTFAEQYQISNKKQKSLDILNMQYVPITEFFPSRKLGSSVDFSKTAHEKRAILAEKDFQFRIKKIFNRYLEQLGI